jgi:predicted MFS family arabinose efflux permease
MKLTAAPILKRWGFKRVLCGNAWISSALVAALALLTVHTPGAVIIAVLLVGGFFRSLQFTSLNTLGYADIEKDALSRATSLVGVVQQLSLAAGVAVAAMLLDGSRRLEGRSDLLTVDFSRAFLAVGVISLASLLWYRRLAPDAGAEMSGHRTDGGSDEPG